MSTPSTRIEARKEYSTWLREQYDGHEYEINDTRNDIHSTFPALPHTVAFDLEGAPARVVAYALSNFNNGEPACFPICQYPHRGIPSIWTGALYLGEENDFGGMQMIFVEFISEADLEDLWRLHKEFFDDAMPLVKYRKIVEEAGLTVIPSYAYQQK